MNVYLKKLLAGMGSVLAIAPSGRVSYIDVHDITHESVAEALRSDWTKVGDDLLDASKKAAEDEQAKRQA